MSLPICGKAPEIVPQWCCPTKTRDAASAPPPPPVHHWSVAEKWAKVGNAVNYPLSKQIYCSQITLSSVSISRWHWTFQRKKDFQDQNSIWTLKLLLVLCALSTLWTRVSSWRRIKPWHHHMWGRSLSFPDRDNDSIILPWEAIIFLWAGERPRLIKVTKKSCWLKYGFAYTTLCSQEACQNQYKISFILDLYILEN